MNIQQYKNPFPYLIVKDFYADNELEKIWDELIFLLPKLSDANNKNSAVDENGIAIKKNKSIFLDEIYFDRNISNILQLNRKLFCNEICDLAQEIDIFYNFLRHANRDKTLVNYYNDGDGYPKHKDLSMLTAITVVHKTPKQYLGGEFVFDDYDLSIELENNSMILFPSFINHSVNNISVNNKLNGRFSITQFIGMTI